MITEVHHWKCGETRMGLPPKFPVGSGPALRSTSPESSSNEIICNSNKI